MAKNDKDQIIESFSKQMRKATREIHSISDMLINAKIGFAISDTFVWGEGLLLFYEIFKYLEEAFDRIKNEKLSTLDIDGMRRTEYFEKDLCYYLGPNWKENYSPRPSVKEYLGHLEKIECEDPILLSAYVYHLYMGLFSGGQILKKKRSLTMKLTLCSKNSMEGLAVVDLQGKTSLALKKQMREAMDNLANSVDSDTRLRLIEESKMVFILNNKMVQSIEGTNIAVFSKFLKFAGFVSIVAIAIHFFKKYY